ncbi:hypothetical protein HQ531_01315 [bacterium]|nr:hypothetical protein [bacterium]
MPNKALILLLIFWGLSLGQSPPPGEGKNHQNMEAIRVWKLTETLELTEDQVNKFLPLINIHERKIRAVQKEIDELSNQAGELRAKGDISQKDADRLIKLYSDKMDEIHKIKYDFMKSLPKHLSPEQQLVYLGFEARFRKDLKQYMKDRRGDRTRDRRAERP